MRIKNKEIRSRRHRKEQKIKEATRELRVKYGDAKAPTAEKAASAKKAPAKAASAKKSSESAAKAPAKKAAPKKKSEPAAE